MASYRESGVDLEGAVRHVDSIASLVTATWGDGVVGEFGGFAAGTRIPKGYTNPVLMMSTDGVGTKLDLARQSGLWGGVGFDLVAMCVDDLTAVGARPIGFVNYLAVGQLDPERDNTIVASIARACATARCPLLGGETAEHPGVMATEAVDLAGAVMGVVEEGRQLSPTTVAAGDFIVGLASTNLRSNGFSLIRSLFTDDIPYEQLLDPSVIYGSAVLAVADRVKSAAHITGGGLPGNIMRAVPPGLGARIDTSTWQPPTIFEKVAAKGVAQADMFQTFNMGIGFCLITERDLAPALIDDLVELDPVVIGTVTSTGEFELV